MVLLVLMSVAARAFNALARPLCVGVALAIGLMFALLGTASSTTGMTGMTEMINASSVTGMDDRGEAAVLTAVAPAAAAMTMETGGDGGPTMASMCESLCVIDIGGECTVAAGLAVTALLALLLASRRDTFLGLLARAGPLFYVRRRRRDPTPWTVLSLSSLCVLRV